MKFLSTHQFNLPPSGRGQSKHAQSLRNVLLLVILFLCALPSLGQITSFKEAVPNLTQEIVRPTNSATGTITWSRNMPLNANYTTQAGTFTFSNAKTSSALINDRLQVIMEPGSTITYRLNDINKNRIIVGIGFKGRLDNTSSLESTTEFYTKKDNIDGEVIIWSNCAYASSIQIKNTSSKQVKFQQITFYLSKFSSNAYKDCVALPSIKLELGQTCNLPNSFKFKTTSEWPEKSLKELFQGSYDQGYYVVPDNKSIAASSNNSAGKSVNIIGSELGSANCKVFFYNWWYYNSNLKQNILSGNIPVSTSVTVYSDLSGKGTSQDPYIIKTNEQFGEFVYRVNHREPTACARLDNDIVMANASGYTPTMIGTEAVPYKGTFDGNGHTVTVVFDAKEEGAALFRATDGATIKNLKVAGTIATSQKYGAGIVAIAQGTGTTTLGHCESNVTINSTVNGDGTHGGLVGVVRDNTPLTIDNCAFTGAINGSSTSNCGGLVGWTKGSGTSITNSLVYAKFTVSAEGSNTIARSNTTTGLTLSNNYFVTGLGTNVRNTEVTTDQLKSGEFGYNMKWYQNLGTDAYPTPVKNGPVHKISLTLTDKKQKIFYATDNASLSQAFSVVDNSLNNYAYFDTKSRLVENSSLVTTDLTLTQFKLTMGGDGSVNNPYVISNLTQWDEFCKLVNAGGNALCAKLGADVSGVTTMLGNNTYHYKGTFDGQLHTLFVNITGTGQGTAPFYAVEGATIKNLTVDGTIKQTGTANANPQSHASGLVGMSFGVNIENCHIKTAISFTSALDQHSGGLIGHAEGKAATIKNSSFTGSFNGPKGYYGVAGLIGWSAGNNTVIDHCFVGATVTNANDFHPAIYKYRTDNPKVTATENYYCVSGVRITGDGLWSVASGTPVTEEKVKNGFILSVLGTSWAQQLGTDAYPSLVSESKKKNDNYVYYESRWYTYRFVVNDGNYIPVGLNFMASIATMNRTMRKPMIYTVILPFNWTPTANDNIKVYTLSDANEAKKVVYFKEAEGNTLEAYKPYLIVPGGAEDIKCWDVEIKTTPDHAESVSANGVTFNACYAGMDNATAAAANAYILQSDKQWRPVTVGTSAKIAPYRAYLTFDNASAAKSYSIAFGDGTTTGINTIGLEDADGTVRYYDLSGRYVGTSLDDLPHGVYIGNGKKIAK